MLLLSKEDIRAVFTMKEAIEADKKAYALFSEGKSVTPLRTNIPAGKTEGSFLFMPAYVEEMECAALKTVSVFPDNAKKGLPTTPAQVFLLDGKTGIICAMLDGTCVTQIRTGAASGAAFDLLAKKRCRKGALIGTGGQAKAQLEAMMNARSLEVIQIAGRNFEHTKAFAEEVREAFGGYGIRLEAVRTADEAAADADLIITVTTAEEPVFDGSLVKKGATVSAVGSYLPQMQELPPVLLKRASRIYFDSRDAVLAESGDILKPLADGTVSEADFTGDLGDVILGRVNGRQDDEEIIVFKSVGMGIQDLVTAKHIYEKAKDKGIGTVWE